MAHQALRLCVISILSCLVGAGKYVPIEVDVPSHVEKVFTSEDIAKYDGTDVSKEIMVIKISGCGNQINRRLKNTGNKKVVCVTPACQPYVLYWAGHQMPVLLGVGHQVT